MSRIQTTSEEGNKLKKRRGSITSTIQTSVPDALSKEREELLKTLPPEIRDTYKAIIASMPSTQQNTTISTNANANANANTNAKTSYHDLRKVDLDMT